MATQEVHIVMVGPHINSVWTKRPDAEKQVARLIEVNGDQLGVRIFNIELRPGHAG